MNYLELVDEYLRERFENDELKSNYAKRVRRYLMRSIEHLNVGGILSPVESDFQNLEAWARTQLKSVASVSEWVREAKKFYDWKFKRRQIKMFDEEHEGQQERESLQVESETFAGNEDTSIVSGEVTGIYEVSQDEPVNVEAQVPITEAEQPQPQARRGRKPKQEDERRSVKLSIYLTPKLYEGLKFLASAKGEDISDVVFTQLEDFVERNSENVENIRNFFASLGAIK